MKTILRVFVATIVISVGFMFVTPEGAHAVSVIAEQCQGVTDSSICNNKDATPGDFVKDIINILLYIVGAISVITIILGGLMYATSAGAAAQVTKAKNIILYSVIGLLSSLAALAIVQFVVTRFI